MRFPGKVVALATAAVLVGCSSPGPAPQTYEATVERIEERPGDFYSPQRGHEPLICITLDVGDPSASGGAKPVRILVLDVYKPAIHGRVGDRVLFSFAGNLPADGELDFDTLPGYRIIPREP